MANSSFLVEETFKSLPFRTAAIYWQWFTSLDCTISISEWAKWIFFKKVSIIFLSKFLVLEMMNYSIPFSSQRRFISSSKSLMRKASFPHIILYLICKQNSENIQQKSNEDWYFVYVFIAWKLLNPSPPNNHTNNNNDNNNNNTLKFRWEVRHKKQVIWGTRI